MHSSLSAALDHVALFEGGYVNHPKDPGGCTNRGITLATYQHWVDPKGTCADVRAMSWDTAALIYRQGYWARVGGDDLPAGLDLLMFDHAVNAGPARAVKLLQGLLGVPASGLFGEATAVALARYRGDLLDRYHAARLDYYRGLKGWGTFGKGWTRRAVAALNTARKLAAHPETPA